MDRNTVVCFDLGGVLIRITHTWEDAAKAAGVVISPNANSSDLTAFDFFAQYQAGQITDEQYAPQLAKWLEVSEKDALAVHDAILLRDYEGALELVESLNEAGAVTSCFSNTNARHWRTINDPARHPSVSELQLRFASHLIGASKPSPEAFLAVAARLPDAERVVYFDDSKANVEAACAIGWDAFWVDPTGDTISQMRAVIG